MAEFWTERWKQRDDAVAGIPIYKKPGAKKIYHDAGQWYRINTETIGSVFYTGNSCLLYLEKNKLKV
jgi:hypothetical protein